MTVTPDEAIASVTAQAAALDERRGDLAQARADAERAIREAEQAVEDATADLAARHRAAIAAYADRWREHADRLAQQVEECDPAETVTFVTIDRLGYQQPALEFKRDRLAREAVAARGEADRLADVAAWQWSPPPPGSGRTFAEPVPEEVLARRAEVQHRETLANVVSSMVLPPDQGDAGGE